MAITGTYEFNGVPVAGAIAQVDFVQFREPAAPTTATFSSRVYASAEQFAAGSAFAGNSYSFAYEANGEVFTAAEAHLLTLPEFSGWSVLPQ